MIDAVFSTGHAGSGWDRTDFGKFRERGLGLDPFGVVAGDDADLSGGVDADAEWFLQMWGSPHDQVLDHPRELVGLSIELLPTSGQRTQRVTDRVVGCFQFSWTQSCEVSGENEFVSCEPARHVVARVRARASL